jgi:hypothetical protein
MSRTILASITAFLIILVTHVDSHAQNAVSVTANAMVVSPVNGTALSSLDFGTLPQGTTTHVEASGSGACALLLSGDAADHVSVQIPQQATLSTTSGGGSSMTINLDLANLRAGSSSDASDAESVDASEGTATIQLSADDQGNETAGDGIGQAYVWIGGSASPAATQQQGAYSGTFTVSVAYTN